ncbi:MAG: hypothetical protein ABSD77_03415 [Verrucomicrobiota bacterium]|jgi:hypothetical protein
MSGEHDDAGEDETLEIHCNEYVTSLEMLQDDNLRSRFQFCIQRYFRIEQT